MFLAAALYGKGIRKVTLELFSLYTKYNVS